MKEFEERFLHDLVPTFCRETNRGYNLLSFKPEFHKVHEKDAHDFVRGFDSGLIKHVGRGLYRAPQSRAGETFFWEGEKKHKPRQITLWVEPIITVAVLSRLHFELGWPRELIGTQSIDWAFDVTTYLETDHSGEYIACEVKKTESELRQLVHLMQHFGANCQTEAKRGKEVNANKKVQGLRSRRAPIFWAVGPGGSHFVSKVSYSDSGLVVFEEASIAELRYPKLQRT